MPVDIHPAADAFPMMNAEQYEGLKADIAKNGQQEDIVYWKGLLVDGRNRLKACRELGIEPEAAELDPEITPDPTAYVISANLHRRHLTTAQRSMVAAKLATLKREDTLKRGSKKPEGSNDPSVSGAAKMLQVSEPSVKRAKHVVANGSKELVKAVESGELNLNQATKLVKAVPDKREQSRLVREGKDAVKEAVSPKQSKPKRTDTEDEADDYDYPAVKAFENADYRLNTLRKIIDGLKPHERQVVAGWLKTTEAN